MHQKFRIHAPFYFYPGSYTMLRNGLDRRTEKTYVHIKCVWRCTCRHASDATSILPGLIDLLIAIESKRSLSQMLLLRSSSVHTTSSRRAIRLHEKMHLSLFTYITFIILVELGEGRKREKFFYPANKMQYCN